jgi:hypothetical protein
VSTYSALTPSKLTKEQLLGEIEDIIVSRPDRQAMLRLTDDIMEWTGRAAAAITRWDNVKGVDAASAVRDMQWLTMTIK